MKPLAIKDSAMDRTRMKYSQGVIRWILVRGTAAHPFTKTLRSPCAGFAESEIAN
jgi:hypothetical protein